MDITLTLARILGVLILTAGASMLLNRRMVGDILERFRTDTVLIWITGVFELIAALALLAVHNDWSGPLAVIVTLIGWAAAIEGALLMLAQGRMVALIAPLVRGVLIPVWGAAALAGGAAMIWFGFGG